MIIKNIKMYKPSKRFQFNVSDFWSWAKQTGLGMIAAIAGVLLVQLPEVQELTFEAIKSDFDEGSFQYMAAMSIGNGVFQFIRKTLTDYTKN